MTRTEHILYSKARISRDKNFDGKFFFAVKTTGIFCRPSCPSPTAKEENVVYCDSIFQAIESGFRPCLRCRPDIHLEYNNSFVPGSEVVQEALRLIYDGYLNYCFIRDLAVKLKISERHLRKLFTDTIGLSPVKIARIHKSVFARKLLSASSQSITDIAFASGFRSIRQFNDSYKEIFGEAPSGTRRNTEGAYHSGAVLHLPYGDGFDFRQVLSFMTPRLIKGIEIVTDQVYSRTFRTEFSQGWFSVSDRNSENTLELTIHSDDVRCYMEIYYRVRKMFDLDTNFSEMTDYFLADKILSGGMKNKQIPRLSVAFDPFEFTIQAILGQQITVKAATTLAARIGEKAGIGCSEESPPGLDYYFPTARELADTDITQIGITGRRQQTIHAVVNAILEERLSLSPLQRFYHFHRDFSALKGIGDWTVNYVAMRGLGMKDAFPASDLGIVKALSPHDPDKNSGKMAKISVKEILKTAEKWKPYRSYAALCLWNQL